MGAWSKALSSAIRSANAWSVLGARDGLPVTRRRYGAATLIATVLAASLTAHRLAIGRSGIWNVKSICDCTSSSLQALAHSRKPV
jgi:hypothetical protein